MAKYRPLYTKFWKDPDVQRLSSDIKLILIYLFTNESITDSGIYPITTMTIASETGVSLDTVTRVIDENKLKNITYDKDNAFIFVRRFKRYNPGGRPSFMEKGLTNDYMLSRKTWLWSEFVKEYPEYTELINKIAEPVKCSVK